MTARRRFRLNLASQPLRNRRFFHLLVSVLGLAFLLLVSLGGANFVKYSSKTAGVMNSIHTVDQRSNDAQREDKVLAARIEKAEKKDKARINLVNSIILSKSFSWVDFLSSLEESLPETCYIVSLAPNLKDDFRMEVRLKVASSTLDGLLKFITRLNALKFKQIRVMGETRADNGYLLWEISLIYERPY